MKPETALAVALGAILGFSLGRRSAGGCRELSPEAEMFAPGRTVAYGKNVIWDSRRFPELSRDRAYDIFGRLSAWNVNGGHGVGLNESWLGGPSYSQAWWTFRRAGLKDEAEQINRDVAAKYAMLKAEYERSRRS